MVRASEEMRSECDLVEIDCSSYDDSGACEYEYVLVEHLVETVVEVRHYVQTDPHARHHVDRQLQKKTEN